ncbi:MAG: hypothetical protein MI923_11570 [Phycisphaerales bacterium]|nr:hypothetical protein [Phycisphaerales bacterium]
MRPDDVNSEVSALGPGVTAETCIRACMSITVLKAAAWILAYFPQKSPQPPAEQGVYCYESPRHPCKRGRKVGCIMLGHKQISMIVLGLAAVAAQPAVSNAGDRFYRHHRSNLDVDIDSLDAEVRYNRGGWQLRVWYDVDIEDARRYDRFDLVLTLTERRRPLYDHWGRPVTIVVPLDYPTKIDRDEIEFRQSRVFQLPDNLIGKPKRLKLHAKVVRAGCGSVLDRKSESVDFKRGFRAPRWSDRDAIDFRRPRW